MLKQLTVCILTFLTTQSFAGISFVNPDHPEWGAWDGYVSLVADGYSILDQSNRFRIMNDKIAHFGVLEWVSHDFSYDFVFGDFYGIDEFGNSTDLFVDSLVSAPIALYGSSLIPDEDPITEVKGTKIIGLELVMPYFPIPNDRPWPINGDWNNIYFPDYLYEPDLALLGLSPEYKFFFQYQKEYVSDFGLSLEPAPVPEPGILGLLSLTGLLCSTRLFRNR